MGYKVIKLIKVSVRELEMALKLASHSGAQLISDHYQGRN